MSNSQDAEPEVFITELIATPATLLKADAAGPGIRLAADVIIEPQSAVLLQFNTGNGSFQGLLAPHREETSARAQLTPTGELMVLKGWIYLVGTQPDATTDWVAAAAESTSLIVQVVPGGAMHRVILKNTAPGKHVTCTFTQGTPPPPPVQVDLANPLLEILPNGASSGPKPIDPFDASLQLFLAYVEALRILAGLPSA